MTKEQKEKAKDLVTTSKQENEPEVENLVTMGKRGKQPEVKNQVTMSQKENEPEVKKQVTMGKRGKQPEVKNQVTMSQKENEPEVIEPVKRNVKDSLFHMIFRDPEVQLSLYNAITGKDYTDISQLKTVTLENAVYLGVKNDCAYIISDYLYMVEQQSTLCGNMPLRHLVYVVDEYKQLLDKQRVYYTKTLELNNPRFIVFYNGKEKKQSQWEERLSEAYIIKGVEPSLELKVTFYNINEGHNEKLKDQCLMLKEYSIFIDKIHYYENKGYKVKEATQLAINACIEQGILKDYLEKERDKIMSSILEYYVTAESIAKLETSEDAYDRGCAEGEVRGRAEGEASGIQNLIKRLCSMDTALDAAIQIAAEDFGKSITEVKEIMEGMEI